MLLITRCKIRKNIKKRLLELFVLEVTARSAASLLGIQSNGAILFYRKIRQAINWHLGRESEETFDGSIELDESYFGGVRKGKRGRGAADKVVVFGILKRKGKVYTMVVEYAKTATLTPIIGNKIKLDSVVYTDSWRAYNALDINQFRHERINHSVRFADGINHINSIENFWSQAKRILRRYNGIDRRNFPLFLKECEFRFNYSTPREQLKILSA